METVFFFFVNLTVLLDLTKYKGKFIDESCCSCLHNIYFN